VKIRRWLRRRDQANKVVPGVHVVHGTWVHGPKKGPTGVCGEGLVGGKGVGKDVNQHRTMITPTRSNN